MPKSKIEILCTLGPASFDAPVIKRLEELGVDLFRINLSHTEAKDLPAIIGAIQSASKVPICLDTEGAQIRTGSFVDQTIEMRENSIVHVARRRVSGDTTTFNFYPRDIVDLLETGDFISIDFNTVLAQVIGRDDDGIVMRIMNGGLIGRNKAVTVDRDIPLDPLTRKDRESLAIGIDMGLRHFALSFAGRQEDVNEIRRLTGDNAFIISKIESRQGLANLTDIAQASDALLIDRGDLSREVPLERIPQLQKGIIRAGKAMGRKVYVATNLLESMVTQAVPTRAEVNDIHNTLLDGADGLVLAAETAIGAHPIACAAMIVKLIRNFEMPEEGELIDYSEDPVSLLVEPHGGHLIQRIAGMAERRQIESLPRLKVPETALLDCEQIAHGTYSPLTGFMDRRTTEAVLETNRLPDGTIWTMPILLQVPKHATRDLGTGDRVALVGPDDKAYAALDVSEVFAMDLDDVARKWFGTTSAEHPGVARLQRDGENFIAGAVTLFERLPSPYRHYELTPRQTRFVFAHKGWSRVVGFHTRNPIHRGHEYIMMRALEVTAADGLYINPVIGPKKKGDFLPGPIMRSYQAMLEFGLFPKGKVALGSFATYSRYAGPREAVFTALCRKNMGCSHFIIGRDHTGFGDLYSHDANRHLIDALGDLGIEPVFFDTIAYDQATGRYGPASEDAQMTPIDGTRVRNALIDGNTVPDWMMRDVIQETLLDELASKRPLFVE